MVNQKKAISPVVATALLLVVAVVAVVGFQTWFNTFQSGVQTNVEQQSNTGTAVTIERLETDGLYLKNSGAENISITGVEVNGNTISCSVPFDIEPGVTNIDGVSSCDVSLAGLTKGLAVDVVIQTKDGVFQETEIVR